MTPQQRDRALQVLAPVVAANAVGAAFPSAHPDLAAGLSQLVSQRLTGKAASLTDDDLRRLTGNHEIGRAHV